MRATEDPMSAQGGRGTGELELHRRGGIESTEEAAREWRETRTKRPRKEDSNISRNLVR